MLKTATAHYKALLTSNLVAFESNLRFGFMQHVQGDGPLARAASSRGQTACHAIRSSSMSAHFLEGVSWESDGRASEAETAYRGALAVVPRARLGVDTARRPVLRQRPRP